MKKYNLKIDLKKDTIKVNEYNCIVIAYSIYQQSLKMVEK